MIQNIKKISENKMKIVIEKLKQEFLLLKTGRANSAILDNIKIEVYGSFMPINQVASISIPEARVIEIKPWDISNLSAIEKAIQKSNLGINPNNNGKIIRLILPMMTEESRKNLLKVASKYEEQFKVELRNIRRDANNELKKAEKDKLITEDILFDAEKEIQNLTDIYINKISEIYKLKEKEIMTV